MPPRKRKTPSEQGDCHSSLAIKKRKQIKLTQAKQIHKVYKNRISKRRRAKLPNIPNSISSTQSVIVPSDSEESSAFLSASIELSRADPQVAEACLSQTVLPYSLNSAASQQDKQKEHDYELKPTVDPLYAEPCVSQTILANSLDSAGLLEDKQNFDDSKPEVDLSDAETAEKCPSQTGPSNASDSAVTLQNVTQFSGEPVRAVDVEDVATSTAQTGSKPTSPDPDDKNDSISTDTGQHFQYSRLYRLLGRSENPKVNGIKAKLPHANVTVHKHVSDGSSYGSQYISTAASWNAIVAFASNKKRFPKEIATIDVQELEKKGDVKFIDLTDRQKREEYLQDQTAKNRARKYEEVLVTGEIPAGCIITIDSLSDSDSDSDSDYY